MTPERWAETDESFLEVSALELEARALARIRPDHKKSCRKRRT